MAIKDPNHPPDRVPLSRLLILGVMQRISEFFNVDPKRVVPISTNDRMKVAQRLADKYNNGKVEFPQVLLYVTQVIRGDQESGYNAAALARSGIYTKMADNENRIQRLHIVPVTLEIEVIYQTNDFFAGMEHTSRWMTGGVRKRLNFTVTYLNFPMDIQVEMSPTMQVPEQDASIDIPNFYEWDAGIRVKGYLDTTEHDDEDQVQMLRTTALAVSVVDDIVKAASDLEDPKEYSTVR